ncbi:hypothetical protein [Capnocytophaga gingivalis]
MQHKKEATLFGQPLTLMLAKTISVVSGSIVGVDCNSPTKDKAFRTASLSPQLLVINH